MILFGNRAALSAPLVSRISNRKRPRKDDTDRWRCWGASLSKKLVGPNQIGQRVTTPAAHPGRGVEMPEVGIPLEIGKGRIIRQGNKIALLSFGTRLGECEKAADELAAHGLSTTIADARFMKPLDVDLVMQLARDHEILITVEEGAVGGFGSHVMQFLTDSGALDNGAVRVRTMVLPDEFLDHDTPAAMYARAGLDAKSIVKKVFEALGKDFKTETVKLA